MLEIVNQLDGFDSRGNIKVQLMSIHQAVFDHKECHVTLPTAIPA